MREIKKCFTNVVGIYNECDMSQLGDGFSHTLEYYNIIYDAFIYSMYYNYLTHSNLFFSFSQCTLLYM